MYAKPEKLHLPGLDYNTWQADWLKRAQWRSGDMGRRVATGNSFKFVGAS